MYAYVSFCYWSIRLVCAKSQNRSILFVIDWKCSPKKQKVCSIAMVLINFVKSHKNAILYYINLRSLCSFHLTANNQTKMADSIMAPIWLFLFRKTPIKNRLFFYKLHIFTFLYKITIRPFHFYIGIPNKNLDWSRFVVGGNFFVRKTNYKYISLYFGYSTRGVMLYS